MSRAIPFFFIFLPIFIWGQQPEVKGEAEHLDGEIFGSIIDSLSEEPVPYVTVLALSQPENKMLGGTVSAENGTFSIQKLPSGNYHLELSFIGYNTRTIKNIELSGKNKTHQLKKIKLGPTLLEQVEVKGGRPLMTYEIDKKVVNVEDQINAEGQTAIEILENIPSISVSADGTVSLRGSSSFTLLIDGVPSAMDASDALATIPANTIKDIEIITNPSAKFDAEGTSGVMNIITKKNKLEGISCLINGSIGTFQNYSGDFAINIKKKKFTYDLSGKIGQRGRPRNVLTERTTIYDSLTNRLVSEGESNWKRGFYGFGGGITWRPNNSHLLSVRTNFTNTLMTPYSDYFYQNYDNDSLLRSFYTDQHNNIDIRGNTSNLFYQYNFKRNSEHYISFKAIANLRSVTQVDSTTSYDHSGEILEGNLYTEDGPSNSYRFNIDYHLPLKNSQKLETGLQVQFGQSGDIGKNYTYNTNTRAYDFNARFSSDVDYIRDVHAAYLLYGGKKNKMGYQIGLRAEYTYRTISSTQAVEFTNINRLDWFPSAHFSYSFEDKSQLIAAYSRRIERPRSYFFEPFITWEGPFNVRSGNPNLNPEYINAFEVGYFYPIKRRGMISFEMYFRQSDGVIRRISSVYDKGILIRLPYNIGTASNLGLELSFHYKLTDWWKVNFGLNRFSYELNGSLQGVDYSTSSSNHNIRFSNAFTYKGWMLQLVSKYDNGSVTAQGKEEGVFTQDISIRKSFMQRKLSISLQGRNVFNTDRKTSFSYTENVTIQTIRTALWPSIRLNVSIKLNNYQKVLARSEEMDDF